MADYVRFQEPRKFGIRGSTGIYCRKCGREIALAVQPQFRTVSKCAICVLIEQGVDVPEDYVLQQYVQLDPSKPPMPLGAEGEDIVFQLFPEEERKGPKMPSGGVWGTIKSVFRAIGLPKEEQLTPEEMPESRKVAVRRRRGSLDS